jgi:hypothetical protein
LKRIQRMPNIPLAYVSVYRRMSDIFHTLTYACTIRNSVTGPLRNTRSKLMCDIPLAVMTIHPKCLFFDTFLNRQTNLKNTFSPLSVK